MVSLRASKIDRLLRRMKRYSLFQLVRQFLCANGIVMRATTHTSQEDCAQKHDEATAFIIATRPILTQSHRHKAFIINMDQTPYKLCDPPKKTLNQRGEKTVTAKSPKTSLGRVTCALTVCADGTKLPPLLIYKGTPGADIEKEFVSKKHDYPKGVFCMVQKTAWTDERVMHYWIDHVLRPYIKTAPKGVVPLLYLDKYACHYQGSVAKKFEDLGVEWDIIPGGCTSLVQPVDVAIGKPFKNRMQYKWEEFMMDLDWKNERIKPIDARKKIAVWALEAWKGIPVDVVWNSWRHNPFLMVSTQTSSSYCF